MRVLLAVAGALVLLAGLTLFVLPLRTAEWFSWTISLLIPLGTTLLVAPGVGSPLWPWELTPLTGRSVGAWLVSPGVVAGHLLIEDDLRRIRPAAVSALVLVVLQAVALVRHWGDLDRDAATVLYCVAVASFAVIGAGTFLRAGDPARARVAPPATGEPDPVPE